LRGTVGVREVRCVCCLTVMYWLHRLWLCIETGRDLGETTWNSEILYRQ